MLFPELRVADSHSNNAADDGNDISIDVDGNVDTDAHVRRTAVCACLKPIEL